MSSQHDSETNSSLPAFPVRWFMFFRRFPLSLFDFKFLYRAIFKGDAVFWDNFMRYENRRRLNNRKEIATGKPKTIPSKGVWRNEELPTLGSSTGNWMKDD